MGMMQMMLGKTQPAYSALVLAQSPRQYLRFSETSGMVAADASGNGRSAAYLNDASLTTGPGLLTADANTALLQSTATTSPISGAVYSGNAAADGGAAAFTVLLIAKPLPAPAAGVGSLFQLGNNGLGVPEVTTIDVGDGTFRLRVMQSGVAEAYRSSAAWAYGTKLHIKLSKSGGGKVVLRVNGVQEGSASVPYPNESALTNIGHYRDATGPDYQYAGTIDEFAVWNSFVSDAATDAMYVAI